MATRFFYLSNLLAKLARLLLYTNSSTKMKKIYIVFIAVFLLVVSFEMLGISEGTSKSQLSRAKVILQDMVRTYIDTQRGISTK